MGNINNKEGEGSYVTNKNDRPRTTIRDMTGNRIDLNHLNIQKQRGDAYLSTKITPIQINEILQPIVIQEVVILKHLLCAITWVNSLASII